MSEYSLVGNVDEQLQFKPSASGSHESANRSCSPTLVPMRIFGPGGENVRALRAALYNYDGPGNKHDMNSPESLPVVAFAQNSVENARKSPAQVP